MHIPKMSLHILENVVKCKGRKIQLYLGGNMYFIEFSEKWLKQKEGVTM